MSMTFQEQKDFLKKRFDVVPLSTLPINRNPHWRLVYDFEVRPYIDENGDIYPSSLEAFICGYTEQKKIMANYGGFQMPAITEVLVWPAKEGNESQQYRIFLVIDKEKEQAAFYFGLNCGLILDVPEPINSEAEATIINGFLDCYRIEDQDVRKELLWEYTATVRQAIGEEEMERLREIARDQMSMMLDRKQTGEDDAQSLLTSRSYPALELTHFVKNENYDLPEEIDLFSVGEYVFWEVIMEKIQKISEEAGMRYVYLFAADSYMQGDPFEEQEKDDVAHHRKLTEAEQAESEKITGKLLSYYRNNYGFRITRENRLIKPPYDYSCYSMCTQITDLKAKKVLAWDSLDTEERRRGKRHE